MYPKYQISIHPTNWVWKRLRHLNNHDQTNVNEYSIFQKKDSNLFKRLKNLYKKQKFFQFKSTSNSTEDIKLIYLCKYDNKCSGRVQIWLPSDTQKDNVQTSVSHQSSHYIPQLKIYLTITKDDNGLIRLSDQTMGLHCYVSVPDWPISNIHKQGRDKVYGRKFHLFWNDSGSFVTDYNKSELISIKICLLKIEFYF